MSQKYQIPDFLKLLVGPTITVILAAATAWSTSQARVSVVETKVQTINDQGSAAFQKEKDKYYNQFLEIQKQLSGMGQAQLDMKEDLKEIKQHLNRR